MKSKNNFRLSLVIANIPFSLNFDNKDFFEESKAHFHNFITDNQADAFNIGIELSSGDFKSNYDDQLPYPHIEKISNTSYNIIWSGLEGIFDIENKEGKLICMHFVRLNSFLRILISLVLLEQQGFIVHASSLIKDYKGYIFPGKSGAGKTTITNLSYDSHILSDEVSLVKKINDEFKAYGTPFPGEFSKSGENVSSSINKILFPYKDDKNFLKKIGPFQALELLLPNVIFYYDNPKLKKKLFDLCFEFVQNIPTFELHFLPDPNFWRSIDGI